MISGQSAVGSGQKKVQSPKYKVQGRNDKEVQSPVQCFKLLSMGRLWTLDIGLWTNCCPPPTASVFHKDIFLITVTGSCRSRWGGSGGGAHGTHCLFG